MRHLPVNLLLVQILFSVAGLTGCGDTSAPEAATGRIERSDLPLRSDFTRPVHLQQRFEPDTENPEYALLPCATGISLPNRFRTDGVITPSLGRTQGVLIAVSCSSSDNTIHLAGLARALSANVTETPTA